MAISSVFGKIFVPSQLGMDIEATLRLWFPDYIKEIEAQMNLPVGQLKFPQRYVKRNAIDGTPGEIFPKCLIVVPNIIGTPSKDGRGKYTVTWRVGIGIANSATTEDDAILHTDILAAAAKAIMLKRGGDYGDNTEWIDEAYDDRPIPNQTNYYRVAALWFAVTINNVVTKRGGPDVPDSAPYEYGDVETVHIQLEKEKING